MPTSSRPLQRSPRRPAGILHSGRPAAAASDALGNELSEGSMTLCQLVLMAFVATLWYCLLLLWRWQPTVMCWFIFIAGPS